MSRNWLPNSMTNPPSPPHDQSSESAPSVVAEDAVPYRPKTKAELIEDLNEVCDEIKLIRAGKLKGRPAEELLNEL